MEQQHPLFGLGGQGNGVDHARYVAEVDFCLPARGRCQAVLADEAVGVAKGAFVATAFRFEPLETFIPQLSEARSPPGRLWSACTSDRFKDTREVAPQQPWFDMIDLFAQFALLLQQWLQLQQQRQRLQHLCWSLALI